MDNETKTTLKSLVMGHVASRSDWIKNDDKILKKRLGSRKKTKKYPYKGAPNFVEPIIDDITTDKTEQEVSMMFNAPRVCHAVPFSEITPDVRSSTEVAFDSYLRYIIKARAKVENAVDTQNLRGFAITKQIREFNNRLKTTIATFEVPDIRNMIVPTDVIVETDLEKAAFICEVHRYTKGEFKRIGKKNGWSNVDKVANHVSNIDREDGITDDDTHLVTEDIVGVTTSKDTKYVVVWELYHYSESDMNNVNFEEGKRVLSIFCPDIEDLMLKQIAWKEADQETLVADYNEMGRVISQHVEIIDGEDRSWPYVQHRAENRSKDYYDTRGVGQRCMDDQIYATHLKNMHAVMLEYYGQPILKSSGKVANTGNITFEPGSVLPQNLDFAQAPQIPQSLEFGINSARAGAGKRMGANNTYNFSQQMSSTRKVQKTKAEIDDTSAQAASISSSSVDRFNEPWAVLLQLIWDDMKRLGVEFPIVIPGVGYKGMATTQIYDVDMMWIPAGSSKTLDPAAQMNTAMGIADWLISKGQMIPLDVKAIATSVLANWDPRTTYTWLANEEGEQPINLRIDETEKNIQMLAQGGQEHGGRLENIEQMLKQMVEEKGG